VPGAELSRWWASRFTTVAQITKEDVFARVSRRKGDGGQAPSPKPLTYLPKSEIGTPWDLYADVPADVDVPAARRRSGSLAPVPARGTPRVPWRPMGPARAPYRTLSYDLPSFQHAA